MGRKPKPLTILKLTGSSQMRRKGIKGKIEPEVPQGRPDDPPLPQYAADLYADKREPKRRNNSDLTTVESGGATPTRTLSSAVDFPSQSKTE